MLGPNAHHACRRARRISDTDGRLPYMRSPMRKTLAPAHRAPPMPRTNKIKLMWILSVLTFFMSAALDNLTTTIVMVALLRKLIDKQQDRWFMAAMVVLAANAGGA